MSNIQRKMKYNPISTDPVTQAYTSIRSVDAIGIVNEFMRICRDTHQTPAKFNKSMHTLYDNSRNLGF
mgnify:CR=1 FL=1